MKNKLIILIIVLIYLAPLAAMAQTEGEFPPFFGGLTENGLFQIVNFQGANVIFYAKGDKIQEAFFKNEHRILLDNVELSITTAKIKDIIPGGRENHSELQLLEAFNKWETDYQLESNPGTKILKGSPIKLGEHQCYITHFKNPNQNIESNLIISTVANNCIFHISIYLFKAGTTPYKVLTFEQAIDTLRPLFENLIVRKNPVPYALLKELLQAEEKYPKEYR